MFRGGWGGMFDYVIGSDGESEVVKHVEFVGMV